MALASVAGSLLAAPALAQSFDGYQNTLLASPRVLGMGGAFIGVGEGSEGFFRNAASLANRKKAEEGGFKIELSLDVAFNVSGDIDLDGDGTAAAAEGVSLIDNAVALRLGHFALGYLALGRNADYGNGAQGTVRRGVIGAGYAFADGAWVVGAGPSFYTLAATRGATHAELSVTGLDLGVLWRPPSMPWRFGAVMRTGGTAENAAATAHFPGELGAGVSWSQRSDGRPYNFVFGADVPDTTDHRYVMLSADLTLVGSSPDGVSVESFVTGAPKVGGHAGIAPHAGVDSEVLDERLRLRAGSYIEPARFSGVLGRPHATCGFDFRLFDFLFWRIKIGAAVDVASQYRNVVLGLGTWD